MWPHLVLLLLSSSPIWSFECPSDCTCPATGSIFCIHRRSNSVPRVPANTLQLYVFQNGIDSLSQNDFTGLTDLDLLDLSQNELGQVPDGAFKMLSKLKNLDLSSNIISHISKDSFSGLVQLERLYLHQNHIQSIQRDAFEGLENLLELKLHGNQLTSLPTLRLPHLLLLDLSSNNIPTLDVSELQTPHLENLRMSSLGLVSLDEDLLASLGNLHELDISMNLFSQVPQALKKDSLKGLIKLNLASNPLVQLKTEDFEKLSGLQELDLSGLKLQGFPRDFFQSFPRLVHLEAAENPFNCQCPLAWFALWLREENVDLGRPGETRCHFPLANAGKMLSVLDHTDFGCPPTTTLPTKSPVGSTALPEGPTTTGTPTPPEHSPDPETFVEPIASPTPSIEDHVPRMCPPNICLNGGACHFDPTGQLACLCPSGASGIFCENLQDVPKPPNPSGTGHPAETPAETSTAVSTELDAIGSRQVTSTSILLDLHLFIETRPNIRGIRLTYRNLSGPDRRPIILSVPASYPEYTLRGLRPNCTYSVCASPLGDRVGVRSNGSTETGSCTEARTAEIPPTSSEPRAETQRSIAYALIPATAALAMALALASAGAFIFCLRRRRRSKERMELELGSADPDMPTRVEGIKANGEKAPPPETVTETEQRHPPQNGNYEVPLMRGQSPSNNNRLDLKPSYF
ncbi:vasorin-like [Stigmatopora nigra]